jgi:hypothetical protein
MITDAPKMWTKYEEPEEVKEVYRQKERDIDLSIQRNASNSDDGTMKKSGLSKI